MLSLFTVSSHLSNATEEAKKVILQNGDRKKMLSTKNALSSLSLMKDSYKLIFEEKEILFLAFLQCVCIMFGYLHFVEALRWVPNEVWDAVAEDVRNDRDSDSSMMDVALFIWGLLVIALVSFPLAILNAAMISVYTQKKLLNESTLLIGLTMGLRNIWSSFTFTFVDAYITAMTILNRLPSKEARKNKIAEELAYYAWKLGTFAVMPALVNGRSLFEAGKDSVALIQTHPKQAIALRFGYSFVCWIVGTIAYIGSVYWVIAQGNIAIEKGQGGHLFYRLVAFPLLVAIATITVLISPFYLLSVTKLYVDQVGINEKYFMQKSVSNKRFLAAIFFFAMMALMTAAAFTPGGDQRLTALFDRWGQEYLDKRAHSMIGAH